jgi:putative aldouronate transport system permease protein
MVVCGLIVNFTGRNGLVNNIIAFFGGEKSNLLTKPEMFRPIFITSNIWQGLGWGSIIYLAAITGIDQEQYEAATIDGASKFKQMLHVTLPGIMPTIVIMFILLSNYSSSFYLFETTIYQTTKK